jgi:hypothetical protein
MQKLSEYYTAKVVNSLIPLYECGQHHDSIDADALAASTTDV